MSKILDGTPKRKPLFVSIQSGLFHLEVIELSYKDICQASRDVYQIFM